MSESSKKPRLTTIDDIVAAVGGPRAIADATRVAAREVTADGVSKWLAVLRNIPEHHWQTIIKLAKGAGFDLTPDDIHRANERARRIAARNKRKAERQVA